MSDPYQKLIQLCDNSSTQLISSLEFYSEMSIGFNYYSMNFTAFFYVIKNYFP